MTELTHADNSGSARMVDVSDKEPSHRYARAAGAIRTARATVDAIRANTVLKGDVLSVAKIAGVMAAKRTADLVPLCHPLPLTDVDVALTLDDQLPGVRAEAAVRTFAQTGVEMEAIVAVTIALVTVYDMAKGIDKTMEIGEVRVVEKLGGKSGTE